MGTKELIKKIYSAFFEQEFPADLTLVVLWLADKNCCEFSLRRKRDSFTQYIYLPVIVFIP
jgi:hypothetical protein